MNVTIVDYQSGNISSVINSFTEVAKGKVNLPVEKLGEMDTELFKEWFQAFSQSAGVTLHIENIYGENSHHKIESCYKGLARSLKDALAIDKRIKNSIPSTKGSI